MKIVISPAKSMDFDAPAIIKIHSQGVFYKDSQKLINIIKRKSVLQISKMMTLSEKLSMLNVARYKEWQLPFTENTAKQAILAFMGDVYIGLDAETLTDEGFSFAQEHLRILSGLYGIIKPLDLIMPYRLEMGIKLKTPAGTNLYHFWGEKLTDALNDEMAQDSAKILLNLASNEYFKAIKPKKLDAKIITPIFKDKKNGKYKVISFFAKKARGMMVRYIIDHKITDVQAIKEFDMAGYYFSLEESNATDWVFLREEQKP